MSVSSVSRSSTEVLSLKEKQREFFNQIFHESCCKTIMAISKAVFTELQASSSESSISEFYGKMKTKYVTKEHKKWAASLDDVTNFIFRRLVKVVQKEYAKGIRLFSNKIGDDHLDFNPPVEIIQVFAKEPVVGLKIKLDKASITIKRREKTR